MPTKQTNFRLTPVALARLDALVLQLGISRTSVMELLLRHAVIVPPRAMITAPPIAERAS